MNIITQYLNQTKTNKYQISKRSGIPYTTICDICTEKTPLNKCSADTIYKLSKATGISCDDIIASACIDHEDFENYKSNVCHELKHKGDMQFIRDTLKDNMIPQYFTQMRYKESLYLLDMLDYVSRKNHIPWCTEYEQYRHYRFSQPIYPRDILIQAEAAQDESIKENALKNAIPEFKRSNIVENEVENVC